MFRAAFLSAAEPAIMKVRVEVLFGSTDRSCRDAAVTPMPLVGTGCGFVIGCAPAGGVAPQTENQGFSLSWAMKRLSVGCQATVS